MEKGNWTFILILSAMIASILLLKGCTKFDTAARDFRSWDVEIISTDDECRAAVRVDSDTTANDQTIELKNLSKGGT